MKESTVKIQIRDAKDASPAALLVQEASRYESRIYLEAGSAKVNAKSIMGMMSLSLAGGEEVKISAEGTDEEEAIAGLEAFLAGEER